MAMFPDHFLKVASIRKTHGLKKIPTGSRRGFFYGDWYIFIPVKGYQAA